MKLFRKITILSLLVIFGACQSEKSKIIDSKMNFEVLQVNQQQVGDSLKVTLNFSPKENRISGIVCNSYSGELTIEKTKVQINKVVSTRKMCANGMKIEHNLLTNFEEVSHYMFDGNTLELKNDANKTLVKARVKKHE